MEIKTSDQVTILQGRDAGKKGVVRAVIKSTGKVVVEKINMVKKHIKPTTGAPHGGIQDRELPLHASKVMLICPHCSKPTRIGHTLAGDGKYVRICKKCRQVIDTKK